MYLLWKLTIALGEVHSMNHHREGFSLIFETIKKFLSRNCYYPIILYVKKLREQQIITLFYLYQPGALGWCHFDSL